MLYMAQTPYDEPLGDPLYRVACVEARFVESRDLKVPASGRFEIPATRPSGTWEPSSVLRPNHNACHASVNQDCGVNALWCHFEDDGTCNCYRPPGINEPADGVLVGPCPACANGVDDDGDGYTDFPNDPDCFESTDTDEGPNNACSNGEDDDGDGKTDWPNDPGCTDAYDNTEADPAILPECADGIDNDGNGATDYPEEPGCFAANDNQERQILASPTPACSDSADNDGDGLTDFPADPGCFDANDLDEDGPAVCFYCEQFTANRPGQCDIGSGLCRPRSGIPPAGGCGSNADCRGAVCDTTSGRCSPCLRDEDCAPGVCDASKGWCLQPAYDPTPCTSNADCDGRCDTALGYCDVDPYYACADKDDCYPGDLCSEERGFCLTQTFATEQCEQASDCTSGACDVGLGWCLPSQESDRCIHDDTCPFGDCTRSGYCEQQTFVFPSDFHPDEDCLRAR